MSHLIEIAADLSIADLNERELSDRARRHSLASQVGDEFAALLEGQVAASGGDPVRDTVIQCRDEVGRPAGVSEGNVRVPRFRLRHKGLQTLETHCDGEGDTTDLFSEDLGLLRVHDGHALNGRGDDVLRMRRNGSHTVHPP